jgi:hypothetical protein
VDLGAVRRDYLPFIEGSRRVIRFSIQRPKRAMFSRCLIPLQNHVKLFDDIEMQIGGEYGVFGIAIASLGIV